MRAGRERSTLQSGQGTWKTSVPPICPFPILFTGPHFKNSSSPLAVCAKAFSGKSVNPGSGANHGNCYCSPHWVILE